jgi:hypothetical protein
MKIVLCFEIVSELQSTAAVVEIGVLKHSNTIITDIKIYRITLDFQSKTLHFDA